MGFGRTLQGLFEVLGWGDLIPKETVDGFLRFFEGLAREVGSRRKTWKGFGMFLKGLGWKDLLWIQKVLWGLGSAIF